MATAVEVGLIIFFIILMVVFSAALIIFLSDRSLFNWSWRRAKDQARSHRYPCSLDRDCATFFNLGPNFVCDPHLKQCRSKAYIPANCNSSDDCLQVTPTCSTYGGISTFKACLHEPYKEFILYGDPTPAESCYPGFSLNREWNFCQVNLGDNCGSTDDCFQGVCKSGVCTFLGDYDVCTEGSSYATQQCPQQLYCAIDPKFTPNPRRCQPQGVSPRQPGAFCATDGDCDNHNCYKLNSGDPVGFCASQIGLVGMPCRGPQDCVQSLICHLPTEASTEGTCVFADPATQTSAKNCPPVQYGNDISVSGEGCVQAVSPVPCASPLVCKTGCQNGAVDLLVIGRLNANQLWEKLYPAITDRDLIFMKNFTVSSTSLQISLNPNTYILTSPFPSPPTNQPFPVVLPSEDVVGNLRGCQPLLNDPQVLLSSYSNTTESNVFFIVNYDPLKYVGNNWNITVIIKSQNLNGGDVIVMTLDSDKDLITYYIRVDSPLSFYLYHNFHIAQDTSTPWTPSAGDLLNMPTPWVGNPPRILPPANLPANRLNPHYLDNFLRMRNSNLPQIYAHFFYYGSTEDTVVSSQFKTLPMQEGGGLATLMGIYVVDKVGSGNRSIVISTLSLFVANKSELDNSNTYAIDDTGDTLAHAVFPSSYTDIVSGLTIYTTVYSFTVIDFAQNWPFTATLLGPSSTQSDVSGVCEVNFTSQSQGVATNTILTDNNPDSIPGHSLRPGEYPVFTPRAYTRIQAQSTLRTADWTTNILFGTPRPTLIDLDVISFGSAGSHSIVGLLFAFSEQRQTLLMTMRFGDTIVTSRYSVPNLTGVARQVSNPTRMYTFYLTADVEESGGGRVNGFGDIIKEAFPIPQRSLAPVDQSNISVWETGPFDISPGNPVCFRQNGECIEHQIRTPWGIEVFTATLIPFRFDPPIRFFRSPSTEISKKGSDDYFVWGRIENSITFLPLFFDFRGIIRATKGSDVWISTTAESCPPTNVASVVLGMDHQYILNDGSGTYQVPQWNLDPQTSFIDTLKNQDPPYPIDPIPLVGRMCETEGYQDGILYRARPYVFFPSNNPGVFDTALPGDVLELLLTTTNVQLSDLQSMAAALSSKSGTAVPHIQDVVSLIGIGGIPQNIFELGINDFFEDGVIEFVGYEGSSATMLPGGYRKTACPANVRANPLISNSQDLYPNVCVDFSLVDRHTMPIVIIYNNGGKRVIKSYDVRISSLSPPLIELAGESTIQMNDGLVTPVGSLGGPVMIYTSCS